MNLSRRIYDIEESRTVRFTPLIRALREQGIDVIDFAVGEPSEDTPAKIISATKDALDARHTRYGPVPGLPQLRRKLACRFEGYDEHNILVTNGSKQALFSIFQAICDPLNEVIISRPYWVSFSEQVKLSGAKPVFVDTIAHQLDCDGIKAAVTARTKAIIVNTPNNPTGAVYAEKDLKKIADIALQNDLYVVSDEAYDQFVYDGVRHHSLYHFKSVRDRVIIVRSFSKNYRMTGFRIGFIAASKPLIKGLSRLQSHLSGNVCTFAQYGALQALSIPDTDLAEECAEMTHKRDVAYAYASELFACIKPRGAFYLFADVSKHLKMGETSEDFAGRLLDRAGVAVVPGEAFGAPGHVRISYAVAEKRIHEGFAKIKGAL